MEGGVLVVGGSASGLPLSDEIHRSDREVTLSVGEHVRLLQHIDTWIDETGGMQYIGVSERFEPTMSTLHLN